MFEAACCRLENPTSQERPMKLKFRRTPVFVLAAAIAAAGSASADPYGMWRGASIDDSFNPVTTTTTTVNKSFSKSEDNDVTVSKTRTEDNDVAITKSHSEDNDVSIEKSHSEDNDYWSNWESHYSAVMPEQSSYKFQDQDAGHSARANVNGSAEGHDVYTSGSRNDVSVGNEQRFCAGNCATFNNQSNPQTQLVLNSTVPGGVSQESTQVAGDVKTILLGPIGTTAVGVSGDVGQSSSSGIGQSGDSANSISDPMSIAIAP
jgi:hypothetical protein